MAEREEENRPSRAKEFEGNTVEEAIEKAAQELNLPQEKIKIQILTEGQRGLFGMEGAKKAKIRVTINPDNEDTTT
ncbi:MAG: Jag N-terminal domain-containing protein [Candidatus Omnitrophica bacterium]|nr:Jag N-terminal domain-containing protein [Candidatus Omnitrophota bacterium]MBU1925345.1 Jag N-terminal domain-containing protein [Candidatus Omnitrophota bacterium]MBU2064111.1 Jag N-terminal domain-containing protein [Candidatus Omnitrophota bacterium]